MIEPTKESILETAQEHWLVCVMCGVRSPYTITLRDHNSPYTVTVCCNCFGPPEVLGLPAYLHKRLNHLR